MIVFDLIFFYFNLEESEDEVKKSPKKRAGYDKDEDFDGVDTKKDDDEFAPDQHQYIFFFFSKIKMMFL
jgi:hypothetical protein